jgi:NAD(P)-dependent dehydrogenase (short-subunit alcohol dehydrogenase family)
VKRIVITGSTRGIGYGLAEEFLKAGCQVMISGRSQTSVDQAVARLSAHYAGDNIGAQPCEVTDFAQVQALWDAAKNRFEGVDIWINNAGIGNQLKPYWEHPPELYEDVIKTNVIGLMYGLKVAITGMIDQGGGHIYNMEGFGSSGSIRVGLTPYGASKYAVRYLNRALVAETKNTPVKVSTLSPGMVATDFLEAGYEDPADFERAKKIFNILADRVETVTPYLVQKMLENDKSGARIAWLSRLKIVSRFMTARFRSRDVFGERPHGT